MNYIIDGFNLGFKLPSAARRLKQGDTEKAIPIILAFIQSRYAAAGHKTIVVFDGQQGLYPQRLGYAHIQIKFSKAPQKADDIIRNFVRNLKEARHWTVVSSDLEIMNTARDMGAHIVKSEDFARSSSVKKAEPASAEYRQKYDPEKIDMDYWLKQFGKDNE